MCLVNNDIQIIKQQNLQEDVELGLQVRFSSLATGSWINNVVDSRDGRSGSKVGQIGSKWDKFETFFRSDFSTFGSMSQMY